MANNPAGIRLGVASVPKLSRENWYKNRGWVTGVDIASAAIEDSQPSEMISGGGNVRHGSTTHRYIGLPVTI